VLLSVQGGTDEAAKDVCMHIAAMRPACLKKEQLPPAEVETERSIQRELALKEGKPANIVDKMVEGRLRNFFAEKVLLEQAFVKDDSQTVSKFAQQHKMEIKDFVHWELGK
jgi:elongation factor Ts